MITNSNTDLGDGIMKGIGGEGLMKCEGNLFTLQGMNYTVTGFYADRMDTQSLIDKIDEGLIIGHDSNDRMVLIKAIDRPYAEMFYANPIMSQGIPPKLKKAHQKYEEKRRYRELYHNPIEV